MPRPGNKPEPSKMAGSHITAFVLPYADMLATENHFAKLIKQTHLDQEYNCRVFTMRQKQDFLDELWQS